jgi:DNA-binding NarL/FixJ family response regulator
MRRRGRAVTIRVMALSVLIVDDHAGFRSWARVVLESAGFEVVGEAGDGSSGLAESERLRPDVVLLDVRLPDIDGFEVADRLGARSNGTRIVLISSRDASDYGGRIGRAAAPFIPKAELSGATLRAALEV